MKTLVVYYSRSGTTRTVAKQLAQLLDADVEEIQDSSSRKGPIGFMRSGYQALNERKASIGKPVRNPGDYDVVIVGTPIWAGRVSSPVRTYLEQARGNVRSGAFFYTSGSGEYPSVLGEMAQIVGCKSRAVIGVTGKQVSSGDVSGLLAAFAERVRTGEQ